SRGFFPTPNADYVSTQRAWPPQTGVDTLVFAPGQTTRTITIQVYADTNVEHDETFFVNLGHADGAIVDDAQGTGTIVNDDLPLFHADDASFFEGDAI